MWARGAGGAVRSVRVGRVSALTESANGRSTDDEPQPNLHGLSEKKRETNRHRRGRVRGGE